MYCKDIQCLKYQFNLFQQKLDLFLYHLLYIMKISYIHHHVKLKLKVIVQKYQFMLKNLFITFKFVYLIIFIEKKLYFLIEVKMQ